MEKRRTRKKAVVLFGPTAVGKTELTRILFSSGYEIINADSVQVYRGLSIASAKPDEEIRREIRHHLVDIRDPWEEYSAGDFCSDASSLINEINERGRIPLITGGTAYYFRMLMYERESTPRCDDGVRKKVRNLLEKEGADYLYSELERVDEVSYSRISRNDIYRITRALEVYYQTGRPLSSYTLSDRLRSDIDFIVIGLEREKEDLKKRIHQRIEMMFESGAEDEIRSLISSGAEKNWPAMSAIGYREWFDALESGEMSLRGIKKAIENNSVKYAKRQMTFFRSFSGCRWFHPSDIEGIGEYLRFRIGDVEDFFQFSLSD